MVAVPFRACSAVFLASGLLVAGCGTSATTAVKLPDAPPRAEKAAPPAKPSPKVSGKPSRKVAEARPGNIAAPKPPQPKPKADAPKRKQPPPAPRSVKRKAPNKLAKAPPKSAAPKKELWSVPTLRPSQDFTAGRATSFARAVRLPEDPFTDDDLHRNFLSIALRAEAADDTDSAGEIAIAKWDTPLRYRLHGAKPADYVQVANVTARLRLLTGLDIRPAERGDDPNMELWFVTPRERVGIVRALSAEKAIGPQVARLILRWRDTEAEKCLGLMATDPRRSSILNSVILIKDELPKRIRDACIVEEVVQSLGLMNDDRRARPSIFNDDQRYLDLTTHDEYLLRILYDRRIQPGMTRRDVAPMLRGIILQLRDRSDA